MSPLLMLGIGGGSDQYLYITLGFLNGSIVPPGSGDGGLSGLTGLSGLSPET